MKLLASLLATTAIFVALSSVVYAQNFDCCRYYTAGANGDDHYWVLIAPPSITYECLHPRMLERYANQPDASLGDSFERLLAITGYAWEINGCINSAGISNICGPGVWCDNNDGDDDIGDPFDDNDDDDDNGFGANQAIYNDALISETPPARTCGNQGSFTRTFSSITVCPNGGSRRSATQLITIADTTPPSLFAPADMTLECGSPTSDDDLGYARVEDLCNPVFARNSINNVAPGRTVTNHATCVNGLVRTITRTWTASDECQESTDSQRVFIVDTLPPIISGVFDETIECNVDTPISNAVATDSCDSVVAAVSQPSNTFEGRCFGEYSVERIWTATDDCGNSENAVAILYVQDTLPPVFNQPPPASETRLLCFTDVPAATAFTATDTCQGVVPVVVTQELDISDVEFEKLFSNYVPGFIPDSGRNLFKRTFNRTYTATDDCGNSAVYNENYYIEQISNVVVTVLSAQPITATRGSTVTINFQVAVTVCTVYGLRVTFNPFPLAVTAGSAACTGSGFDIAGDSYCSLGTTAPGTYPLSVTLSVPLNFEENTLTINFLPESLSRISLNNPAAAVLDIQ